MNTIRRSGTDGEGELRLSVGAGASDASQPVDDEWERQIEHARKTSENGKLTDLQLTITRLEGKSLANAKQAMNLAGTTLAHLDDKRNADEVIDKLSEASTGDAKYRRELARLLRM